MDEIIGTSQNFRSLSIKDLLEGRDQYHYHLMNKPNVVGTAIGLYLIRKADPRPATESATTPKSPTSEPRPERTLANSEVRNYSWPCVLVFVDRWVSATEFGAQGVLHPESMVPRTLYLSDGRMIPVCVVRVDRGQPPSARPLAASRTVRRFAPGMPLMLEVQGVERQATAGCLVTDGHTTYVLTNRHVTGETGETIYAASRGRRVAIGAASRRCITRMPFTEVYPEFPARNTFVNIDVGLVAVTDTRQWTSQPLGLPATGPLADLNRLNITTRLINAEVHASSGMSGVLRGRIKALFYRYKSVGGYDYVADFLIAPWEPADGESARAIIPTQPGDSGTVWHLATKPSAAPSTPTAETSSAASPSVELRPLAVQWGGQVLASAASGEQYAFALATSLTTVCRALDVELVAEQNTGAQPFWGQTGHYTIAAVACEELTHAPLKRFFANHLERITFDADHLSPAGIAAAMKEAKAKNRFIPLADVPDMVWKTYKSKPGGRDTQVLDKGRTTGPEHPTHFADIDEPRPADGKTLRELSLEHSAVNLTVAFWQQFYSDLGHTAFHKRGLLPFRCWQFYDAMVEFAQAGDATRFLCAAGLLAHYVGDACQPLHGSRYADGFADQPMDIEHHRRATGERYIEHSHVGAGVHSTYESAMIDRNVGEIRDALAAEVGAGPLPVVQSGHDAALEVVRLMDRCAKQIDPKALVESYIAAGGKKTVAVQDALWEDWGDATLAVMSDGARVLAGIWQSAWEQGGGGTTLPQLANVTVTESSLMALYRDPAFIPSLDLDQIGAILK